MYTFLNHGASYKLKQSLDGMENVKSDQPFHEAKQLYTDFVCQ